jgi:hypothetical protein
MDLPLGQLYFLIVNPITDPSAFTSIGTQIEAQYRDPSSPWQILTLLQSDDIPPPAKHAAAVGLRKVLTIHLESLLPQTDLLATFLHSILDFLNRPSLTSLLLHHFISSLEPLFACVGESWPDLVSLIFEFTSSSDLSRFKTGLEILIYFLPYATLDFVLQLSPHLSQWASTLLNSQDPTLAVFGLQIFAEIVRKLDGPFSSEFFEFFKQSLTVVASLLITESPETPRATDAIRRTLKAHHPIGPPNLVFPFLLELAAQDTIPIDQRQHPLYLILAFLKIHGRHVRELFVDTLKLALNISATQFFPAGYPACDNSRTVSEIVETIGIQSDPVEFLTVVLEMLATVSKPPESFASLCALIGCVEAVPSAVEQRIGQIIEYALTRIAIGDPTVTESAFVLFARLAESVSEAVSPFSEIICEVVFANIDPADQDLTGIALNAVTAVMENVCQDSSNVLPMFPNLLALAEYPAPVRFEAIRTIAGAVGACRDEAHEIPDEVFALACEYARHDRLRESELIASSIHLIGNVLAFAWRKAGSAYEDALRLIIDCASDDDCALRCSALRALTNIYKFHPEGISPSFAEMCFFSATAAIGATYSNDADEHNPEISHTTSADVIFAGFRLVRLVLKMHRQSCVSVEFRQTISKWMKHFDPKIAVNAIAAGLEFFGSDREFLEMLAVILRESGNVEIDTACIKALKKLLVRRPDEMAIHVPQFVAIAIAGINRELPCQTQFVYDRDLQQTIVELLEEGIRILKAEFPIATFFDTIRVVGSRVSPIELSSLIGVLAVFVSAGGIIPQDLVLFALSKLELCDFTIPPAPVFFARILIRDQPEQISEQIPQILEFFGEKLVAPVSTARYYWETVTNVISGVFDSALSFGNITNFVGLILARLPVRGDLSEAGYIYEVLLSLASTQASLLLPHAGELFRVLVETLAFPGIWFESVDFRDGTVENMVALLQRFPNWEAVAGDVLKGDPVKVARLRARVLEKMS